MANSDPNTDLTGALAAYASGDRSDVDALMRAVYSRLHELATESLRREGRGHTLQPTALVHEAYLRLSRQSTPWRSRAHFYAIAAHAMRRVLVDHARARDSLKRGSGRRAADVDGAAVPDDRDSPSYARLDILALDEALATLARDEPECARVVEMRFFAGMEVDAIAEVLGVSERTVRRHWVYAKAWLSRELDDNGEDDAP